MRVTNQALSQQVTENIQAAFQRLAKVQEVASTGKRINHLSDDAFGALRTLDLHGFATTLDQYDRNVDSALPVLEQTDATLDATTNVLNQVKEVVLRLASDTYSAKDRLDSAVEVRQSLQQLLSLANTKLDGRYIFGGFKNDTASFTDNGVSTTYNGDTGDIKVVTGPSSTVTTNLAGNKVFQGVGVTGGEDLFDILHALETALTTNDVTGPNGINTQSGRLDKALEQVLSFRAETGARINTAEAAKDSLSSMKLRTASLQSQIEDADPIQAYSDLARQQSAFEAALQSASRVIQPSLLDYLS